MTTTDSADAFSMLADATRLSILEGLVSANREDPTTPTLSFSELYERSGLEDSGRFNYHLNKLVGRFVEKGPEGYRLSPAGIRVAGAVFSGYYDTPADVKDEPLGACPACDGTLSVGYESGLFTVSCDGGHAFGDLVPPRVFEDRDAAAAAEVVAVAVVGRVRQAQRGACPQCFGHPEWSMVEPAEGATASPVVVNWQCRTCGVPYGAPPGMFVPWDPEVGAALREHGVDVWEEPVRWLVLGDEWTVTSFDADAGRAGVEATLSGVPVAATVDERGGVREFRVGG